MAEKQRTHTLHLVRRGETTWESEHRVHGITDLPLSSAGRDSLQRAAARHETMPFRTIHHPPDEASTETASMLAAAGSARMKTVEALAAPDLGVLEGLTMVTFADRFPKRYKQWLDDPLSLIPPEGEPLAEAQGRVIERIVRILRRTRAHDVAIVLPGFALACARLWLAGRPQPDASPAGGVAASASGAASGAGKTGSKLWSMLEDRPSIESYVIGPRTLGELQARALAVAANAAT